MVMLSQEEIDRYNEAFDKSKYMDITDISLFGDKNTRIEIVTLLAYIRYAIKNGLQKDITVSIGKNRDDKDFDFTVNQTERADDLVTKEYIEIN